VSLSFRTAPTNPEQTKNKPILPHFKIYLQQESGKIKTLRKDKNNSKLQPQKNFQFICFGGYLLLFILERSVFPFYTQKRKD